MIPPSTHTPVIVSRDFQGLLDGAVGGNKADLVLDRDVRSPLPPSTVDVGNGKDLFFYFFESRSKPEEDDVIMCESRCPSVRAETEELATDSTEADPFLPLPFTFQQGSTVGLDAPALLDSSWSSVSMARRHSQ